MRHLLFDIDGTLISTGRAGSRSLLSAIGELAGITQPKSTQFAGRTDGYLIRELLCANGLTPTDELIAEVQQRYLRKLPTELAQCTGQVLPGIGRLLTRLEDQRQTVVGLLTGNSADGARLKLDHFGLSDHFAVGFFGDLHEDRNALSQSAWETLLEQYASLQPEQVIVIGDTPFDIECAHAIGARSLGCCTGSCGRNDLQEAGATWVLEDLSDVDQVLTLLMSEG